VEFQERAGVVDRRLDLEPVAHDAGVGHQAGDVLGPVAGDALGLEAVEGASEVVALLEDGEPRQPGLETLQHQLLEQHPVVRLGHAPLLVVVARIDGLGDAGPGAARDLGRRHDWLAAASAARSSRTSASASLPATEPMPPITAAPATISAPGASGASPRTGTTRLRTVARFCMRLTTSWPTKQPLVKDTPCS